MTQTIADRLRELAEDEFDGHVTGHTYWEACGGCKLDRIADELDAKATVLGDYALDHLNGRDQDGLCDIARTIGAAINLTAKSNNPSEVSSEYLGADRE